MTIEWPSCVREGPLEREAADPDRAAERVEALKGRFIFDAQAHFIRDDLVHQELLGLVQYGGQFWNPELTHDERTNLYYYNLESYVRQIFLNSDTSVAVLSGAPFDEPSWWILPNEQIYAAVNMVNTTAGSTRMLGHAAVTPGQPGWMDEVDQALAERPSAGWKLYPVGDPLSAKTKYPFWLDDDKLMYPRSPRACGLFSSLAMSVKTTRASRRIDEFAGRVDGGGQIRVAERVVLDQVHRAAQRVTQGVDETEELFKRQQVAFGIELDQEIHIPCGRLEIRAPPTQRPRGARRRSDGRLPPVVLSSRQ